MKNDDEMCEFEDKNEFPVGDIKLRSVMSSDIKVSAFGPYGSRFTRN